MKRWATVIMLLAVGGFAATLTWQWWITLFTGIKPSGLTQATRERVAWPDRVWWLGSPGALSTAHAGLSQDCQACHIPFQHVADRKCLSCHAKNVDLVQRRDTAFHADATRCITCHVEHQGRLARISRMEHAVLNPEVGCAACHVDRHQTFFGERCIACHGVETWQVSGFRHPSPRSRVCAECHQPPPGHLLGHFQMVDQTLTGQWEATTEQCWRCHTTDHWNNIVGVGFYKHH